jgi:UDP-4-amino-4,6-dideoxy-N-acetyl-beta-L-altrosamine transaminase
VNGNSTIPYGRQSIDDADVAAVEEVLRSDYLTQGPTIPRFERALAEFVGAPHVVAANSATSVLHIACVALGVGPGDLVWTVPNTFVASANCARYCGADVDFVDIEPGTWNMSVPLLEQKLVDANRAGRLPKVVIPVAFAGLSCDMRKVRALADRYGFRVIEDASHAVGGSYLGQPVGARRDADITVFSFHPVKIITTAEGGAAVTHDAGLAARMARLRTHGITRDAAEMEGESEGPWYYQMIELGWNYRMTDLQAALGLSQMKRLAGFVRRRRELADRYDRLLAGSGHVLPGRSADADSAWHLYVIGWDEEGAGRSRREAFEWLRAAGIGVNVHYIPVHLQPYYRRLGFRPGQFPAAEQYYRRAISIPLHAGLTDAEQDRVVAALRAAAGR